MPAIPWTLTVLVNNYVKGAGLLAEHGLALHLSRSDSDSILFDTGQTGTTLVHNAAALDIDLAAIGAVVLSHGHYDHTGGLLSVARPKGSLALYAHPAAFEAKLKLAPVRRDIGMPFSEEELEDAAFAINRLGEPLCVAEDLLTTGEVPRTHDFEQEAVAGFYHVPAGMPAGAHAGILPDPITDDLSLIALHPEGGFSLICGCCHAGLLNTLERAVALTGDRRIHGIIGGLHTIGAGAERMSRTVEALRAYDPDWIAPIHCSGQRESAVLHAGLGERVRFLGVGDSVKLAGE